MLSGLNSRLGQPSLGKNFRDRRRLLMRRHSFKTSPNRILPIAVLQLWKVVYPNINILSISFGRISDVLDYLPQKNQWDTFVLFIGAYNFFQKNATSPSVSPSVLPRNSTSWETPLMTVTWKPTSFVFRSEITSPTAQRQSTGPAVKQKLKLGLQSHFHAHLQRARY